MSRSNPSFVKRFLQHEAAVALIEFALIFPIFFLILFGGIEMTRLLLIQQRLERAGYVLADLTTQYQPATSRTAPLPGQLTETEMVNNVFPQLSRIMNPYQDTRRQAAIVTSLTRVASNSGGGAMIQWQLASTGDTLTGCDTSSPPVCVTSIVNGLSPSAITPAVRGRRATFPSDIQSIVLSMRQGSNFIVAEVFYYYQPILGTLLRDVGEAGGSGAAGFRFSVPPRIYVKRTFFVPRNGDLTILPPRF